MVVESPWTLIVPLKVSNNPALENRVQEKPGHQELATDEIADSPVQAPPWDASRDRTDAVVGIRRGLEASAAGRVCAAADVFERMRRRLAEARR